MVTISKTWSSGLTLTATDANSNFSDFVTAFSAGTEDYSVGNLVTKSTFTANSSVCINATTQWPQLSNGFYPPPPLAYSDSSTVQASIGNYVIGNQVYELATAINWSWSASGSARGLVTGVTEASATYYYLYAVVYSNAVGVIGTTTSPSGLQNTALDYDSTNMYLGTILNDSAGNISGFDHMESVCKMRSAATQIHDETEVTFSSYTAVDLDAPPTADMVLLSSYRTGANGQGTRYYSYDGSALLNMAFSASDVSFTSPELYFWLPVNASNTIYAADSHASKPTVKNYTYLRGWRDKYL